MSVVLGAGGVNTDVQVADRPVTQQGMTGMRTAGAQGPGRQVADKSFFLNELRQKKSELSKVRLVGEGSRCAYRGQEQTDWVAAPCLRS